MEEWLERCSVDRQIAEWVDVGLMNGHLICWMNVRLVIGWKFR